MKTAKEFIASLPEERQQRIHDLAAELIRTHFKEPNFITLNMRQLAACMRRIGLVNSGDSSLQQLTRWCNGNRLSFNLDGVRAGVKIKVEITAREHMETVDLLITQD